MYFCVTAECGSRDEFASLLIKRDLTARAAEIGTHRAEFAARFLSAWPGTPFCVDHWLPGYDPGDPAALSDRSRDYAIALGRLRPFGSRAVILRMTSEEAAAQFEKESLDFVYIDAKHRYDDVLADLRQWWPRVRPGGLLAGHDIVCVDEPNGGWGRFIQPAVGLVD